MRRAIPVVLSLCLLAGCSGSKKSAYPLRPPVVGGSEAQQAIVRRAVDGLRPTNLTQIRIAPAERPFRNHFPANAVMLRFKTTDRTLLTDWEAEIIAGVFRDRSVREALPELAAYVYPGGGEGFGEVYVKHTYPRPPTKADTAALRKALRSAAARAGAKVLRLRTLTPHGLAAEAVLQVRHPAVFVRDKLNVLLDSFFAGSQRREGQYLRVVDGKGQRVAEWGGSTRLSGGMSWVQPRLQGCNPALQFGPPGRRFAPCPVPPAYQVVAPVLRLRTMRRPMACAAELTSYPPAGCSGVPVRGFRFKRFVRENYGRTGWQTGALRLTGTWDGHVLTVIRAERSRGRMRAPGPPRSCRGPITSRRTRELMHAIPRVAKRINLMQLSPCPDTVWVLVGVADRATADFIHRRFGPDVEIAGWLSPI